MSMGRSWSLRTRRTPPLRRMKSKKAIRPRMVSQIRIMRMKMKMRKMTTT